MKTKSARKNEGSFFYVAKSVTSPFLGWKRGKLEVKNAVCRLETQKTTMDFEGCKLFIGKEISA